MNLIEQLGGYEEAKASYEWLKQKGYCGGDLDDGALKAALLEYRRKHNIFEVGDYVVFNILGNEVIQYADWLKSQNQDWIRHATDSEIAAGHGL